MSIEILTKSILSKMPDVSKWQVKFFVGLVVLWIRLRGRYTFENLTHQGFLRAATYRENFSKGFDINVFTR